ncbi:MAG TPA: secretin N-terminal domain-containing protein [Verrucomicrobiae bacterium]|nr:secretin N-terminal domain-containing protein [Verrucomicrobiae bacterium]
MILKAPKRNKPFVALLASFLTLVSQTVYAQQPAAQPVSQPAVEANNNEEAMTTVTLDFKDADINTVLRVMSLKSGVNIVAGPEVQGTVTIRLENVPWKKALEVVLRTYGYVFEKDGNIIRVTTRENLAAEPLVTKTFILNYSKAAEVMEAVKDMLTERGRIKVAERTNMLVITDIPTNLYSIEEVVTKLDKVTPQAYIDSKVVKTDVGTAENLGVEWRTGGDSATQLLKLSGSSRPTTFPFASKTDNLFGGNIGNALQQYFPVLNTDPGTAAANPNDPRGFPEPEASASTTYNYGTLDFSGFSAILQMLKTRSNTKVVSNPRIVVLNNQSANIQVGSDIPLPTFERNETTGSVEISGFYYRQVGVVLKVTPHINSEEEILVDLNPEVSSTGANIDFGEFQIPSFNVTKAITQVLIRSGETIAIGGLLTDNVAMNESKVPYLADLPLVGKAFRSKRQTAGDANKKVETLFFVTVTMVDTEGQPAGQRVAGKQNVGSAAAHAPASSSAAQASGAADETASMQSGQTTVPPAQNAQPEAGTAAQPPAAAAQ